MKPREIFFTQSFKDFYINLDEKSQEKIDYSLHIIATENRPPTKFFKHITNSDGFFEVRASVANSAYRVIAFFTEGEWLGALVLLNGFEKKNNKKEYLKKPLKKAASLRKNYLESLKESKSPPSSNPDL